MGRDAPKNEKKRLPLQREICFEKHKSHNEDRKQQKTQHLGDDDGGQEGDTEVYSRGWRFEENRQETQCQVRYTLIAANSMVNSPMSLQR